MRLTRRSREPSKVDRQEIAKLITRVKRSGDVAPLLAYLSEFEEWCYRKLKRLLRCPRCDAVNGFKIHRSHRYPVIDYRCERCGRVFNAFTGTPFAKTSRSPAELIVIVLGVQAGLSTTTLAKGLGRDRMKLSRLRRRLTSAWLYWSRLSSMKEDLRLK